MSRILLAAILVLGASVVQSMAEEPKKPEGAPAKVLLTKGLEQAKREGKPAMLVFGSPTCGWCRYLEKFLGHRAVAEISQKHFVVVHVDIDENPGGQEMYDRFGPERGVPAFSFLASDESVISDSMSEAGNVGFPYTPEETAHYFKALRKACPKLNDAEAEVLAAKLIEVRPKLEQSETP